MDTMQNECGLRTDSTGYNSATKGAQLPHEARNAAENYAVIVQAFADGRARDVSDEPKANKAPCLVIGSGGSLDIALPLLDTWKGGIICTTSHALSLMRFGVQPTHIVALDPFCQWSEIEGVDWARTRTKLVTVPTVWPDLIHGWPGEMLLYRQNMGQPDSFYHTTLNHQYSRREGKRGAPLFPLIKTEVTLFACSPPLQLFVAQVLGYGDVFLCGCDFSYTYNKDRFTDWTPKESLRLIKPGNAASFEIPTAWEEHPHPYDSLPESVAEQTIMGMNGIPMHPIHAYYKKNTISAWRLSKQDVWTTDHGAITEMPYADIKRVIKQQGHLFLGRWSDEKKARAADEYLALQGAFVIELDHGMSFVEATDPAKDLVDYMRNINRQYLCSKCGADLKADGDDDQTGKACPICKALDTLKRKNACDIEANMERIYNLLRAAKKTREAWQKRNPPAPSAPEAKTLEGKA